MYKKYTQEIGMPKRLYHKIWLIMRLTTIILLVTLLQVSATTRAQNLTLKKTNASLKSIFSEVKKQTGYIVLYPSALVNNTKPVTVNFNNIPLKDAMDRILENQNLEFEIQDNSIVVRQKAPTILDKIQTALFTIDVRGKVIDEKGQPLPGVTIKLKDESQVTTTDKEGRFILKAPNDKAVIVISFIGYLTKEINYLPDLGTIQLEVSNSKLDEVQVIAYGTTSKRLSTGNVSSIKAADIEKQPVSNPLLALVGRVPSLQITQNSGLAGSGVTVRIQGRNSLRKGNEPFYVVDGVPYNSRLLPNFGNTLLGNGGANVVDGSTAGGGSPFSYLNPADIESIDVLKDADATAIYGSRAANGAILITTKKGKAGQTKVDITMQQGVGQVPHKVKMMNTQQYLQVRKEAYANDGLPIPNSALPNDQKDYSNFDLTVYDPNKYTDWQKELIGGTASYTDIQTAISGGDTQTTFRVNGGFHRETTVFPGDFANKKGAFGFNINHTSINQKFKAQFSGNYLVDENRLSSVDLTEAALKLTPNSPAIRNMDGTINWERILVGADSVSSFSNPIAPFLNNPYTIKTNNLFANGNISYQLLPKLAIKSSFGYNKLSSNEFGKSYPMGFAPERQAEQYRSALYATSNSNSWIVEPQINYHSYFGKNLIDVLIGGTFQENDSDNIQTYGIRFNNDDVMDDIRSAPVSGILNTLNTKYKYAAIFGRLNYNLEEKYLLNLTFRRDGSSRFGSENQFHNFGAIGAAWVFSSEEVIKNKLPFLSFGKVKASFGTTGNDQIGDYQFLSLYETPLNILTAYQGVTSLLAKAHSNAYLQWEETKKAQAGIELGLFKDRIYFNMNYYRNTSSNQLLNYALPALTGFNSVIRNLPATVSNMGWEFAVTSTNVQNSSFSWTSSFNLTLPKNKLIRFDNLESSSYKDILILGQPITIRKGYLNAGVDAQTGNYQVYTLDGSKTFSPGTDDFLYSYTSTPSLYGGLQNTFSLKGWTIDFFLQFVKQTGASFGFDNPGQFFGGAFAAGTSNLPVEYIDHWKKPGDNAIYAKATQQFSQTNANGGSSNLFVSDASFVRLKNASISYQVPLEWKKALKIQNLRVYLQGQNLITFTKYKGLDPETQSNSSLPALRVITVGIQSTF